MSANPEPAKAAAAAAALTAAGAAADARTVYQAIGGEETFRRIVGRFYRGVADDPVLRPMYPPSLEESERHMTLFLTQYFGGPATYSAERGHPRLRMRHAGFRIGPAARDRWLHHMRASLDGLGLPPLQHDLLWDYLERAAHSLLNTFDG